MSGASGEGRSAQAGSIPAPRVYLRKSWAAAVLCAECGKPHVAVQARERSPAGSRLWEPYPHLPCLLRATYGRDPLPPASAFFDALRPLRGVQFDGGTFALPSLGRSR